MRKVTAVRAKLYSSLSAPSALVTLFILTSRSFAPFSSVSKSNRTPRRLTFHRRRSTAADYRFAEIESYQKHRRSFSLGSFSTWQSQNRSLSIFFYLPPRKGSGSKEIFFLRTLPLLGAAPRRVYRYRFIRFELLFDLTRTSVRERDREREGEGRVRFETLKYQAPFVKDNLQTGEQHRYGAFRGTG